MAAATHRPKILWVMEPLIGGTLQHLECFLAHTDPADFEVHLAVSVARDPSVRARFDVWRGAGWTVHEVTMVRSPSPVRDAAALLKLWRLCRRERFDLVHTHCAKAGFLGRLAARLTGTPAVHTPHVFPFDRGGGRLAEGVYSWLERRAGCWTDRVVLLSRYQFWQLEHRRIMAVERTEVIPNGVDTDAFGPTDRGPARGRLGLSPDLFVVLAAGRLCRQKGFDILVDAAAEMASQPPGFVILIAGAGEDERALRAHIESKCLGRTVKVVGKQDSLTDYYEACNLVAMPSRYEGCPYVLLEAMASGRPVACAAVSGMDEFVRDGETGYVLGEAEGAAWAAVLGRAAGQRAELDRMGAAARRGFRPEWEAGHSVSRLHDVYAQVLREQAEEERSPGEA
jgi:glycosyltransferase involved in cell wall biosynthesis